MKISQRIRQLDKMVTASYDHIWDCCCDHGLLGLMLLQRKAAGKIHFVDVVEPLMQDLKHQLLRFFPDNPGNSNWQVYCEDVAKLPLSTTATRGKNRQLIIIAGVGGELLVELVKAILLANPGQELEFLLCPVHHNYKVRRALNEMKLGLVNEHLMRENNRFYEILHVATTSDLPVSLVGSQMWDFSRSDDRQYLNKTLKHYRRMSQNADKNIREIIDAYQALV